MNKQAQGEFVHPVAPGKGERFANEASETPTQGAVPALDVAGFACFLATQAVGAPGKASSYASQKSLRGARQR